MEVVPMNLPRRNSPAGSLGLPFNKRNVEEWSRLDRLTGMMETAKIETDHWAARSSNAAHKYGKMIDSRERNNVDGSLQQRQRKQMEVYQTHVPGGSMQVIRTQTYTTSSSSSAKSSKWPPIEKGFDDLELPINSLDLSSQKTKGSVGRSGSIGGRRPPSRPRSLISQPSSTSFFEDSSVSRLCQRLHDQAKANMFNSFPDFTDSGKNFNGFADESDDDESGVVITEIIPNENSHRNNLSRQKSCSNENLAGEDENVIRRSSKVRRSLQFPKQQSVVQENDWIGGKSLKERAAEIENLLRRGSSTATSISQDSDRYSETSEKSKSFKPRDSFVSAETLKEVRDRLKKANANENDDGIVTEKEEDLTSRVKCFVHGMETLMAENRKPKVNGTGSLESRSSCNGSRSAEWYRRRKSYGFEQVEEPDKIDKFNRKYNMESSTDSGICHSSETVATPTWNRKPEPSATSIVALGNKKETSVNSVYVDGVTSVRVEDSKRDESKRKMFRHYGGDDVLQSESVWNRKSPLPIPRKSDVRESLKSSLRSAKNPWISQLRGTKLVDRNWASDEQNDSEEAEHDTNDRNSPDDFKSGLVDSESANQKKNKKVEFCKTEVHFAAESGKFNIVETDGKPPPNDIFRRRRRNSGPVPQKNPSGLPETKFGDSVYEKRLLTTSDSISDKIEAELKELSTIIVEPLPQTKDRDADEFKNPATKLYDVEEESNDIDNLKPRSILKNYRKSFLLGESEDSTKTSEPSPTPVWKSTVILRNKLFDDMKKRNSDDGKLYSSDGESELQIRFRNLKKADPERKKWWETSLNKPEQMEVKRRSLPDDILLRNADGSSHMHPVEISNDEMPSLSVAERIKQVEELRLNNYSSKINFKSGEMTVVQNGTGSEKAVSNSDNRRSSWTSHKWDEDRNASEKNDIICDNVTTSNPPVMRFSTQKDDKTDSQKYQTTRILINFQNEPEEKLKTNNINKWRMSSSYGSWSPGMKKDLGKYFTDLKSTSLVRQTIQPPEESFPKEDIPKPSKPIHEIITQFDSLSLPRRGTKERRRKTMPINYKAPKEYTHADLEEELKNFTENLDKDFKDIYEEEIGSLQGKSKDVTVKKESVVRPVIVNRGVNLSSIMMSSEDSSNKSRVNFTSIMSSSDDTSKKSRTNYDSDDSDLLADEEVRSYMSTGQGNTDSESEEMNGSWSSKKNFHKLVVECKKQEINVNKVTRNEAPKIKPIGSYIEALSAKKTIPLEVPKIASIALRYEDDPLFTKSKRTEVTKTNHREDRWEKTSNSSSTQSSRPRERASYLNGLSLSEKYSKYLSRSSNSSLDSLTQYNSEPIKRQEESKYISRGLHSVDMKPKEDINKNKLTTSLVSSRYRNKVNLEKESLVNRRNLAQTDKKRNLSERLEKRRKERDETDAVILEELTRAADEILIAVNGYTDEDSHVASSDDEEKSRRILRRDNKLGGLGTISEGKRVTKTETRRSSAGQITRRSGHQSSASSLESLTKETLRGGKVCPRLKQSEAPKVLSSRATRLLQRANSRDALLAQQSSSEDIPSYVELSKKRVVRRQRSSASTKSDVSTESKTASSRVKSRTKPSDSIAVSKPLERKPIALKESTNTSRSTRKSQPADTERTNSISKRLSEKTETESSRRRRVQRTQSKDDPAIIPLNKAKTTRVHLRKVEGKSTQVA